MSRRFLDFKTSRVLVLTGARLATVILGGASMAREDAEREIDETELENSFVQALWQAFDRERASAGIKMRVHDLEVAVADVRLLRTVLDGHAVPNPIGFSAKEISFSFEIVLSPKYFLRQLYEFISEEQLVFISDRGAVYAQFLTRSTEKLPEFSLLYADLRHGDLYAGGLQGLRFLGEVAWGREAIGQSLQNDFCLPLSSVEAFYRRLVAADFGPGVLRGAKKSFSGALAKCLASLYERDSGIFSRPLFLASSFDLPRWFFEKSVRLAPWPPLDIKLAEVAGLPLAPKIILASGVSAPSRALADLLVFHAAFSLTPSRDKIDRVARRHARWLLAS